MAVPALVSICISQLFQSIQSDKLRISSSTINELPAEILEKIYTEIPKIPLRYLENKTFRLLCLKKPRLVIDRFWKVFEKKEIIDFSCVQRIELIQEARITKFKCWSRKNEMLSLIAMSLPMHSLATKEAALLFQNCTNLVKLKIGSLTSPAMKSLFKNCTKLTQLSLSSSIKRISNDHIDPILTYGSYLTKLSLRNGCQITESVFKRLRYNKFYSITLKNGCQLSGHFIGTVVASYQNLRKLSLSNLLMGKDTSPDFRNIITSHLIQLKLKSISGISDVFVSHLIQQNSNLKICKLKNCDNVRNLTFQAAIGCSKLKIFKFCHYLPLTIEDTLNFKARELKVLSLKLQIDELILIQILQKTPKLVSLELENHREFSKITEILSKYDVLKSLIIHSVAMMFKEGGISFPTLLRVEICSHYFKTHSIFTNIIDRCRLIKEIKCSFTFALKDEITFWNSLSQISSTHPHVHLILNFPNDVNISYNDGNLTADDLNTQIKKEIKGDSDFYEE